MNAHDVTVACDQAAAYILFLMGAGILPANTWAFVRPIDVYGDPDRVLIWTLIISPN